MAELDARDFALIAAPMHGQAKLVNEGYRTRDGHLIEWFGRHLQGTGPVAVVSRPEPALRKPSYDSSRVAPNTRPLDTTSLKIPNPLNRRRWWATSAASYPKITNLNDAPVVSWNPFHAATALRGRKGDRAPWAIDLLDDWSVHYAFKSISDEVENAYRHAFDAVDHVFTNSEGTLALAHRFGRTDARLLLNGTDPERFDSKSKATGPLTVGYVGKIGRRVDLDLVLGAADGLPGVKFVFAGPVLDREYTAPMEQRSNITLLGDVHYEQVPALLQTFDIGWVPHRVGKGEVGGDVIKTYEYRAAGLPVLTTPIAGVGDRGFTDVSILEAKRHLDWLASCANATERPKRSVARFPEEMSWRFKSSEILRALGLSH